MTRRALAITLLLLSTFLGACATKPQEPLALDKSQLTPNLGKVGVIMTPIPKIDTELEGAGCLLCYAAAAGANSALTKHTQTLSHDNLPKLKEDIAALLRKKGIDAMVIPDDLVLDKLQNVSKKGDRLTDKDFGPVGAKYGVGKLVVLEITALGMLRTYSAYFPTSDPKGMFKGVGYLVDVSSNEMAWYQPVDVLTSAEGAWDEPPTFPGLTNAYFKSLEQGKDLLRAPFKE